MSSTDSVPTLTALRAQRQDIVRLAERRGAHNVRVFGSIARGEARADSDIDLLVDMEPGRTALDLSELILDLEETLGRKVDVVEVRRPSSRADQILREAVAL
jgi:uncharacterized protein